METLTAEKAAKNLLSLISSAHKDGQQYRIESEEGSIVLLSLETYQNLIVTLELLTTPGLLSGLKMIDGHASCLNELSHCKEI